MLLKGTKYIWGIISGLKDLSPAYMPDVYKICGADYAPDVLIYGVQHVGLCV